MPLYYETFDIGLEDAGPGYNPATEVVGQNESNLKFIYKETGADVSVRGRGSSFIEPRTGRESILPLHVLVQHESSYENYKKACRLVQDLIKTVRDDWYKIKEQYSHDRGSGITKQDFLWKDDEIEETSGYSRFPESDFRGRDLSDDERSDYDEEEVTDEDRNFEGFNNIEGCTRQGGGRGFEGLRNFVEACTGRNRISSPDLWQQEPDVYSNSRERSLISNNERTRSGSQCFQEGWESGPSCSRVPPNQQDDRSWMHSSYNQLANEKLPVAQEEMRGGIEFGERQNQTSHNEMERARKEWAAKRIAWARHQKNLVTGKKSRWGQSTDIPNPIPGPSDKNVLGLVLDQKKKIEEKLDKIRMTRSAVGVRLIKDSITSIFNPLQMNKDNLQELNHKQLLEVSQQQQDLLMKLANSFLHLPLSTGMSDNSQKLEINRAAGKLPDAIFNLPPVPPPPIAQPIPPVPPPREILKPEKLTHNKYWGPSQNVVEHEGLHFLYSSTGIIPDGPSTQADPTYPRRTFSSEKQAEGVSSEQREQINQNSYKSSCPVTPFRVLSPSSYSYSQNECRSQQIKRDSSRPYDGQERYSPQLEDSRANNSELIPRENKRSSKRLRTSDPSNERKRKQRLRYRVAVINNNLNKLTPLDEQDIKTFVVDKCNSLSGKTKFVIDFIGLSDQERLYVLMPHTLEGMNWLLSLKRIESSRHSYMFFPYEDVYNRYKMKTIIYFDMLEGYKPSPAEIILEVGRINDCLMTDVWKLVRFSEERLGFFLMLNVDHLSYLCLQKLRWKVKYRTSYICLEPVVK